MPSVGQRHQNELEPRTGTVPASAATPWVPTKPVMMAIVRFTIIFRAWKTADQHKIGGRPMSTFTIRDDGTDMRRVTEDDATNWSPYPAPDGRHFVFVKLLPPRNFEIYLGDLETPNRSD
jgi:hypothetical protein